MAGRRGEGLMRVHGQELAGGFTQRVTLARPDGSMLALTLQPLPLGFHRRLRTHGIVPPQPPIRVARDANGQPLRDASGQAATLRDVNDETYLTALEQHHQRVAVLAVVEALGADESVEFTAQRPAGASDSWSGYADALFAELEAAGITAGELVQLCSSVCRMSRLMDDDLRASRGRFFSGAVKDTA
jgi:hypothetical protein